MNIQKGLNIIINPGTKRVNHPKGENRLLRINLKNTQCLSCSIDYALKFEYCAIIEFEEDVTISNAVFNIAGQMGAGIFDNISKIKQVTKYLPHNKCIHIELDNYEGESLVEISQKLDRLESMLTRVVSTRGE